MKMRLSYLEGQSPANTRSALDRFEAGVPLVKNASPRASERNRQRRLKRDTEGFRSASRVDFKRRTKSIVYVLRRKMAVRPLY